MKTVAILDEILLTLLLFSYNRLHRNYSNLQNRSYYFMRKIKISRVIWAYNDVAKQSERVDTFMETLISLDSTLFTI